MPTPDSPTVPLTVVGEFSTASSALVFAGWVTDIGNAEFGHSAETGTWWVATQMVLATGRELISAAGGRVHIGVGGRLAADRGWGDDPPTEPEDHPEIVKVDAMDVVRAAGLHRHVLPAGDQVTVLAPARQVSGVVQRALDLGLTIGTRLVRVDPLFASDTATSSMFELRLASPAGPLPVALLGALDRDARVLVCRPVSERLLVRHDMRSPLPDEQLAALAERAVGAGSWLLADAGFGSALLTPLTDLRDGATLVRVADQHRLADLDENWAELGRTTTGPQPVPLRVVRARTPGEAIEAVLLDDEDLACLPALLSGRPLADLATLASGRDRHLMLAPGGVLDRLPVGEPLYRLGPGPLFLPLGTRTQPLLPPSARQTLFGVTQDTALVLLPDTIVAFPLAQQQPVWTLWAGPLPSVDLQLPPEALRVLTSVDEQAPASRRPRVPERAPNRPAGDTWQEEALAAELADDLVRAAELCERHGELRRAAHLYERAAHQPPAEQP